MVKRTSAKRPAVPDGESQPAPARGRPGPRKVPARRLKELGELVAKAGLDGLPSAALMACFIRIAEEARDPRTVVLWSKEGRRLAQPRNQVRDAAVVTFSKDTGEDIAAGLRERGFEWNRVLGRWEGVAFYDEAAAFVGTAGGRIAKIGVGRG